MSQTRSIVAGGTAAVLLLGVGTSILFAEPPRASGDIGGPVVVTAAPVTDLPAGAASAPPTEAPDPSTVPSPSTREGALPAGSGARPAVTSTPVDAPGPPSAAAPAPPPSSTDHRKAGQRVVDRGTTDGLSTAEQAASAPGTRAAPRDETRTTVTVGRSGPREPWHGWIPTPRRSDACGTHR